MSSSPETRVMIQDDTSATWFVCDRVIRVLSVLLPVGTETELPDAPSLGECFDIVRRKLWERVRYEHELPTYAALSQRGGQQ